MNEVQSKQLSAPISEALVKVNRKKVLAAFDSRTGGVDSSNASSITGLLGEDLALGCLLRYLSDSSGRKAQLVNDYKCKGSGVKGKRLDAWVHHHPDVLYQVEIKNWSAHSLSGRTLHHDFSFDSKETLEFVQKSWDFFVTKNGILNAGMNISKAWDTKMIPPPNLKYQEIRPLVIFWQPLFDPLQKALSPLSSFKVESADFNEAWIFSASAYLRSLKEDDVILSLPRFKKRLQSIDRLLTGGISEVLSQAI